MKKHSDGDSPSQHHTIRRVGSGENHHFFGYYNKCPWDPDGKFLLAQRVSVMSADILPNSVAEVGYFDLLDNDKFYSQGQTTAWNWQMGSQLQWLGTQSGTEIIYNVRTENSESLYPGFGSNIVDLESGETRQLGVPIYSVAPSGVYALCVDYRRLLITHPTIGYSVDDISKPLQNAPVDDGIHALNLLTGEVRLLISYAALREFHNRPSMKNAIHWVSHIEINPSSSRFLFLHRWTERVEDETCFLHRLVTMDADGSNLRLLECSDHPLPQLMDNFNPDDVGTFDYEKSEYQISHPIWVDDVHIIAWSPHKGRIGYHVYKDVAEGSVDLIGDGLLTENGHMSFSTTNQRWLLSDTYPDARTNERALFVYDVLKGERSELGAYVTDPKLGKENRCDLHPRWSRDGRQICIDSVHEAERQMYIVKPDLPS